MAEPDGRDRVVEWTERHLRGRDLPWQELREILSPPYWGHYVFHDNNRDAIQVTQPLTRAVFDNRGTVDKFIGDAVLALFGSPEELPPKEQALRAIAVARSG